MRSSRKPARKKVPFFFLIGVTVVHLSSAPHTILCSYELKVGATSGQVEKSCHLERFAKRRLWHSIDVVTARRRYTSVTRMLLHPRP